MKLRHLNKLDQRGFHHVLAVALAFIILFGAIGTYFFIVSHAANAASIVNGYGQCLDNKSGSHGVNTIVQVWDCNSNGDAQYWQTGNSDNTIRINGNCLGVSGDHVASGAAVVTLACDKNGKLQTSVTWKLQGKEIVNVASNLCLASPQDSQGAAGTQQVLFSCQGGDSETWSVNKNNGGNGGGSNNPTISDCRADHSNDKSASAAQCYAHVILRDHHWGEDQFKCLDHIFTAESGWQWNAKNPGSGAYGIPQALPGSKMADAGPDWLTNPVTQIRWAVDKYIPPVYKTPCKAWYFHRTHGWYIQVVLQGKLIHV